MSTQERTDRIEHLAGIYRGTGKSPADDDLRQLAVAELNDAGTPIDGELVAWRIAALREYITQGPPPSDTTGLPPYRRVKEARPCEVRRPVVRVRAQRHRSPTRRRKTSSSSGSRSSDSADGDGGGDPPDADPDLETYAAPGEDIGQLALRVALTITWSQARGELDLVCDEHLREVVEAALPIVLVLLRHKGLMAEAAPQLFGPGWALHVEEGSDDV